MLQLAVVIGTSLVFTLFGVFALIVLWKEGVNYRRKCLTIIKVGLAAPALYAGLVLLLSFCEYPLGW